MQHALLAIRLIVLPTVEDSQRFVLVIMIA